MSADTLQIGDRTVYWGRVWRVIDIVVGRPSSDSRGKFAVIQDRRGELIWRPLRWALHHKVREV